MKTPVLLPALLLLLCACGVQRYNNRMMGSEVSWYRLDGVDTLTDIGCGWGDAEYYLARRYPTLAYVLEDLPLNLQGHANGRNVALNFNVWSKKELPGLNERYRFVEGTPDSIPLPTGRSAVVLCRKTVHEFNKAQQMVRELMRILAPGGRLLVADAVPGFPGQVDAYCGYRRLYKEEVVTLFSGLQLRADTVLHFRGGDMYLLEFTR